MLGSEADGKALLLLLAVMLRLDQLFAECHRRLESKEANINVEELIHLRKVWKDS